jgi:hypothetical protein
VGDLEQVVERVKSVFPDLILHEVPGRPGLSLPRSNGWVLVRSSSGALPIIVTTTAPGAHLTCDTIDQAAEAAVLRLKELPFGGDGFPKGQYLMGIPYGKFPEPPPSKPPKSLAEIFAMEDPRKFQEALTYSLVYRGEEHLNPAERAVLAIWWLEGEVSNGSFDQYFHNSSGGDAAQALRGLTMIGAVRNAEILRKAMAVFPGGQPSPDRKTRHDQMEALGKEVLEDRTGLWSVLSDELTDYPEPLDRLIRDYCLAHREEFGA